MGTGFFERKLVNIFAAYGAAFFYTLIFIILASLGAAEGSGRLQFQEFSATRTAISYWPLVQQAVAGDHAAEVFMLLVFAPLVEELLFRALPLILVLSLAVRHRREAVCIVVIVACGVMFGIVHGAAVNVFLQGVGGVILGLLFLANRPSFVSAYFSCVLAHALINFTLLAIQAG